MCAFIHPYIDKMGGKERVSKFAVWQNGMLSNHTHSYPLAPISNEGEKK